MGELIQLRPTQEPKSTLTEQINEHIREQLNHYKWLWLMSLLLFLGVGILVGSSIQACEHKKAEARLEELLEE